MMARIKAISLFFLGVAAGVWFSSAAAQVQLNPGDILVSDADAGTNGRGALFRVDPSTGQRSVVSDFGVNAPLGVTPTGVAIEADGQVLVTDPQFTGFSFRGALFRVNPTTGVRTILSDFSDSSQGPLGAHAHGVAVETAGDIVVVDQGRKLFRVDPITGHRIVITDFNNATQGPLGIFHRGVAIEANGQILVTDQAFDQVTCTEGALFRVDPSTGQRIVLSNFCNSNQGPMGADPEGVAIEANGQILVVDQTAPNGGGALFRVDPVTGQRTVVSVLGAFDPLGVAVESTGQVLVIDIHSGTDASGVLFRVNPSTGQRVVLSDFGNLAQGARGVNPTGVAVVAGPVISDTDQDGVPDGQDNCPNLANANQLNTDGDGEGDACDTDDDNDAVPDTTDNCPLTANPDQGNNDGDGMGDACDPDDDNDGVPDVTDSCPLAPNQGDTDGDGIDNACDADDDADGKLDTADNCPLVANSGQEDFDRDGIGDVCDSQTGPPSSIDQCMGNGWAKFDFPRTFKNQGDCIQFVNTRK